VKIEKKYGIILFVLFFALSLSLTIISYYMANSIMLNKYEELYHNEAKYMISLTEKDLDQLDNTFNFLSHNETISKIIKYDNKDISDKTRIEISESLTNTINALMSMNIISHIKSIQLKTYDGQEYWYGSGNNFGESDKISKLIKDVRPDSYDFKYLRFAPSFFKLVTSKNTLQFVKYIYGTDGKPLGYFYFELNPEFFNDIIGDYQTAVDSEIYFIDSDNKILYNNAGKEIGSILDEREVSPKTNTDILVRQTLSKYDWSLIIKSSKDQITEENAKILKVTILMAIVSTLIELFALLFIIRKLFTPINSLSRGLKSLRKGDFNFRIEEISDDDIGEACNNFNNLADTLQITIQKELDYQLKLKDSEYKALQSQINPHFLYNSLNSLKWMAHIQHANNITSMVDSLWKLFKAASSQNGPTVKLRDELALIEAYSYIQQVRYKHKFELQIDIDESLLNFEIPKFILQPFVENSIFHGIAPKKDDGIIKITASNCSLQSELNDALNICVSDDGVGMDEEMLRSLLLESCEKDTGKGLNNIAVFNIQERLFLLYGRDDLLTITSEVGIGTTVSIILPKENRTNQTSGSRTVKRMKKGKK